MNCPKCKSPISDEMVLKEAAAINGRKGGQTTGPTKARDSAKMREAQKKSVIARKLNARKPRKIF
jgi:general stress protein YciG